LILYFLI